MTTKTIMINSDGINWCWYHCYTLGADGLLTFEWSDRFHKFDEMQGAGQHPEATHTLVRSFALAAEWKRGPDSSWPADWLEREDRAFEERCAAMQLDPAKVESVLRLAPVDTVPIQPIDLAVAK